MTLKIFALGLWTTFKATVFHDDLSTGFSLIVATIGSAITFLLGGYDYPFLMLIGFIILDYATGFICAAKKRKINSDTMYWGLTRKIFEVVMVGIAVALDRLFNNPVMVIRLMVIYFYIGMEGISVLENMVKLGVKVPPKLVSILEHIEEKEVSNEEIKDKINAKLDTTPNLNVNIIQEIQDEHKL
jgi:toxin secretion/phage lysis holin